MLEISNEISCIYNSIQNDIEKRIHEFKMLWKSGSDYDIFVELVFCIMTPQSKAKSCGKALSILKENNFIMNGDAEQIADKINIVRFRNNKAAYIVEARNLLSENNKILIKQKLIDAGDPKHMREWLVNNIKGIGYKEASHFLRNIGFGDSVAILDRHILKNMKLLSIISEIPKTLSPKVYYELETKLIAFSKTICIPPDHLDFVLWYKEAGEVYK